VATQRPNKFWTLHHKFLTRRTGYLPNERAHLTPVPVVAVHDTSTSSSGPGNGRGRDRFLLVQGLPAHTSHGSSGLDVPQDGC
jgi:hypothetical protein